MISLYSITCLLLGTFLQHNSVNAFTSTPTRTFLETPRVATKLGVIFSEPAIVDVSNQNTVSTTSNSILISSSSVATFRNNFPIGQSIHPTVNEYAKLPSNVESTLQSLEKKFGTQKESSGRGFQILGVSDDPYNLASAPDYLKNKETNQPEIINPKELEFLALELDFLPKLPLAAAIYIAFEFFFMNTKRQIEEEEGAMYYDDEEEEAREVTQFWSVVGLRTFAAFAITFVSLFISKLDIAQINSFIR